LVSISAQSENNQILIKIKDDGIGIKQEEITRILERGVRADQSVPGHGIGLAIVQDILQANDAKLSIESKKSKGTCAIITFTAVQKPARKQ
jgi:two-component system, OmpR family, sensor histidine kinase PhoQ